MQGIKSNIYRNCLFCDQQFKTTPCEIRKGGGKYCSQICYKIRPRSQEYKDKLSEAVKKAYQLGTKKPVKLLGTDHWRWIKDRSQLAKQDSRNDSAYKEWRKQVWLRDNFKCRIANKECNGRIEAHHILVWKDYTKLRYEINNGITLCHNHHPTKRAEEQKLVPIFQELLRKD